ncbi:TPA: hypothetical protein ACSTNG_003371 [Serratia fonticola]
MYHPDSVTYDAFDCNGGNPHEPNTHWDPKTSAWEWDDLKLNPGSVPDSFPQEVKEALENNICIICGKKNCPYIKNNKDYQKLTDELKKGDAGEARKIYMTKFAQRRGQSKGVVMEGLQKSREAKKRTVDVVEVNPSSRKVSILYLEYGVAGWILLPCQGMMPTQRVLIIHLIHNHHLTCRFNTQPQTG